MEEAVLTTNPKTVRFVFSLLLVYSEIEDPTKLYTEFVNSMGEDFCREKETTRLTPLMERQILEDIEKI